MEPTHFLAARAQPNGQTQAEIDAFYEQHGWDAFALSRTTRRIARRLRQIAASRPKIADSVPAE